MSCIKRNFHAVLRLGLSFIQLAAAVVLTAAQIPLQPGALDPSFNPGAGMDNWVGSILIQPDGKLIAAGAFSSYNKFQQQGIVRLNPNGTLDSTFAVSQGTDDSVWAAALQADGKILAGGRFERINSANRRWLVRLNDNGSIDTTFNPELGGYVLENIGFGITQGAPVTALAIQAGGKILVGGQFETVAGQSRAGLARLHEDGTLDHSFTSPLMSLTNRYDNIVVITKSFVHTLAVQADGKILVGGMLSVNGTNQVTLARLNADGSRDEEFDRNFRTETRAHYVQSIALQTDGKILIAGNLAAINGHAGRGIARLNSDGTIDKSFQSEIGIFWHLHGYPDVHSIAIQNDDKIVIGGGFNRVANKRRQYIARLNPDGSLDEGFSPLHGFSEPVFESNDFPYVNNGNHPPVSAITIQPDGNILLGGNFASYNEVPRSGIARVIGGNWQAAPPVITGQPTNQDELIGGMAFFAVETLSATPLTYQWLLWNEPIAGATNSTLELTNLQMNQAGLYTVSVSNTQGSVNSTPASLTVSPALREPGNLDPSFAPRIDGPVYSILLQADGKMIVSGEFAQVHGVPLHNVARLNMDGSVDTSFNPGTGPANKYGGRVGIRASALQKDGKIIVAGRFDRFNEIPRRSIARLNADGSVDISFDPGTGPAYSNAHMYYPYKDEFVERVAVLENGQIAISGSYDLFNGVPASGLLRLNSDGTLDSTYDPSKEASPFVWRQSTGKILVLEPNSSNTSLRRYHPTYHPDSSFKEITSVGTLDVQPNDRILASVRSTLKRFDEDGNADSTFPNVAPSGNILTVEVQPDGNILVGGTFNGVNGITRYNLARVFGDSLTAPPEIVVPPANQITYEGQTVRFSAATVSGSLPRYQWQYQGQDIPGATNRILEVEKVRVIQAGEYRVVVSNSAGVATSTPATLTIFGHAAGERDPEFRASGRLNGAIEKIVLLSDGKLLIGGSFTQVDGVPRSGIARLLVDGSLDTSFDPGTGISGGTNTHVKAIAVQFDGRILIGGQFSQYNGTPRPSLARLSPDGSLDESFRPEPISNLLVKSLAVQADGQILIGGTFRYTSDPMQHLHLVRLHSDGSLDASYSPSPRGDGSHYIFSWDLSAVNALLVRRDGKVIVAGGINRANDQTRKGIIRLNPDGSTDTNFYANMTVHDGSAWDNGVPVINAVVQQPDDKLLVAGRFSFYNLTGILKLARLNPDGSRDTNFNVVVSNSDTDGEISGIALQADGKILVGGSFQKLRGVPRGKIARLNPDGSLDMLFDGGASWNGLINTLTILDDSTILAGGTFRSIEGIMQEGLARLHLQPDALLRLTTPTQGSLGMTLGCPTLNGKSYVLETSDSMTAPNWQQISTMRGDGNIKLFTVPSPSGGQRYYRVRME